MMNVTNLPVEVDATLTLEQRVAALEAAFGKFALAGHNAQYAAIGSPRDKAGARVFKGAPAPRFIDAAPMIALERDLAYSAARSDIEFNCVRANSPLEKPAEWARDELALDNVHADDRESMMAAVARAVEYLDYRGLLVHALGRRHIMTIKDAP